MAKITSEDTTSQSKGSQYPYYPITSAMKMAEAIKALGGARTKVTKSVLAKHLGEEEGSSAFSQQITSAKIFGVIEGFGEYVLTDIAKRYFFPMAESEKPRALLDIFTAPEAYKKLVLRFDGQKVPSKEILGNIMHQELGVPQSWIERSAALFLNSAQFVGATDSHGILRVSALRSSPAENESAPIDPPPENTVRLTQVPNKTAPSIRPGMVNWNYKSILVQTPEDLDTSLWDKLNAYVQLLKPD